jgi:hypothetical protein
LHARGLDDRETRRILKHLEANQSAFTKAALDSIRGSPEETFRRLQFPAEGDPIPDVPLGSILVPLTEIVVTSPDLQPPPGDEEVLDALPNSGFPVFRLQQTKAIWYSLLGCFAGFALGSFVAVVLRSLWVQITAPVAGLALGWIRGNSERWDICSDPVCKTTIPLEAATCPGCGGLVAGSIRSSSERLDAEEEFERRNKPKRRPMKRRKPTSRPPRPQ